MMAGIQKCKKVMDSDFWAKFDFGPNLDKGGKN
jgi:hypothetical protein